ncbi:MMPL family transporter [Streptomyces sp. NPDC013157]|uniref:MMPL family transporter n=1 Tax=Streptomyces sp. NPDC013157 TaxID=3364861 RepID=UPI0036CB196D
MPRNGSRGHSGGPPETRPGDPFPVATLLYRLGRTAFRRRWLVTLLWAVILGAVGVGAATAPSSSDDGTSFMPGIEAQKAFDLIGERFPGSAADGADAQIVFVAPDGEKVTATGHRAAIDTFVKEAASEPQVAGAVSPFTAKAVSKDGSTAYATVNFKVAAGDLTDADKSAIEKAIDQVRDSGLTVEVGGSALAEQASAGGSAESIGIVLAAVVLLIAVEHRPDVVVMDIRMPDMDGVAATAAICARPELSQTHVLVLTTFENDENVAKALRAGASGFLGKGVSPEVLLSGIRTVAAGESLLSPSATRALITRFLAAPDTDGFLALTDDVKTLTDREREVTTLAAYGRSNADIAEHLVLSPLTVRSHIQRAMAKLHARDRAQLVVIAYQSGLVKPHQTPGG